MYGRTKMITLPFSLLSLSIFVDSDLNHRRLSRESWVRSPPPLKFWRKYYSAQGGPHESVTNVLLLLFYVNKIQIFSRLRRDILKNIEFTQKCLIYKELLFAPAKKLWPSDVPDLNAAVTVSSYSLTALVV